MATVHYKQFNVSQLPSIVKDGMSIEEEATKRRKTCRFIEESGRILKLPRVAIATAMVFFHRFYCKHSFSDHDRFEVAVASLLLAAKTEESPKKLVDLIKECYNLKLRGMQAGRMSAGTPATASTDVKEALDPKGEEFSKLKERILLLERVLLHTIGFELSIDHPYKFLVETIKRLVSGKNKLHYMPSSQQPKESLNSNQLRDKMMHTLVQWAMNFSNDSMHTTLCLQYDSHDIAMTTVYLAGQFSHIEPIEGTWQSVLNLDIVVTANIALQIIELISDRKGNDQATFRRVRHDLERLKEERQSKTEEQPDAKRPRVE